jgi:hypothetical protein
LRDYQAYVGTASPFNFNGLVRHYYLRDQPHEADIQINLLPKEANGRPKAMRSRNASVPPCNRSAGSTAPT